MRFLTFRKIANRTRAGKRGLLPKLALSLIALGVIIPFVWRVLSQLHLNLAMVRLARVSQSCTSSGMLYGTNEGSSNCRQRNAESRDKIQYHLERSLLFNKTNSHAHFWLAMNLLWEGELNEVSFDHLPSDPLIAEIADKLYSLGETELSRTVYSRALARSPGIALTLGERYVSRGDPYQAMDVLEIGIANHRLSSSLQADAHETIGEILRKEGGHDRDAIRHLREALSLREQPPRLEPANAESYYHLGMLHLRMGNSELAIRFLRLSKEHFHRQGSDTGYPDLGLGYAFFALGNVEKSLEHFCLAHGHPNTRDTVKQELATKFGANPTSCSPMTKH